MSRASRRRLRIACQVLAFGCAAAMVLLVNSSLIESRFSLAIAISLFAVGATASVVGVTLARRDRADQADRAGGESK
jgi:peptidoglycan/LPS O-acetylase OafA/YrhL